MPVLELSDISKSYRTHLCRYFLVPREDFQAIVPAAATRLVLETEQAIINRAAKKVFSRKKRQDLNHLLATQTPSAQVNVLVFDQFEELFTQADPAERNATCALLSGLGSFKQLRTHVLATLRDLLREEGVLAS